MKTSSPSRKMSVRNPSHLGSKIKPSPGGSALTRLASIGSTGGFTARSIATLYPATVPRRGVAAAGAGEACLLRIRTKRSSAHETTSGVAIDPPLRRDDTLRRHSVLHPPLERGQHAVLRIRVRSYPLPEIVRDIAAAAVSHSRHDVKSREAIDILLSEPGHESIVVVDGRVGRILAAVIDHQLATSIAKLIESTAQERVEAPAKRRRARHHAVIIRRISLGFHQPLTTAVGAAAEIRIALGFSITRIDRCFRQNRHLWVSAVIQV